MPTKKSTKRERPSRAKTTTKAATTSAGASKAPRSRSSPNDVEPTLTAFHEAAHSVVELLLGGSLVRVTIQPDLNSEGACVSGAVSSYRVPQAVLIVLLAGPIAEAMLGHRVALSDRENDDMFRVVRHYEALCAQGMPVDSLQSYIDSVGVVLVGNWQLVELLANALMRLTTLSGAAVARLIVEWGRGRRSLDARLLADLRRVHRRSEGKAHMQWMISPKGDGWSTCWVRTPKRWRSERAAA